MQKPVQELTPRISDCLKVIYSLQEQGKKISTSAVSERLKVSDATVTMLFKEFAEAGWVEHMPYHGVRFTKEGERRAMEVVRHHRLLELYLVNELGYSWDKVHAEADRLEHVISEEFEDKLDALLGSPTVDPHGDPIPSKDGGIAAHQGQPLAAMQEGQSGIVLRIEDQEPEKLSYLGKLGLYPGTRVQQLEQAPFDGPVRICVGDPPQQTEYVLSADLAKHIVVENITAKL